MTTDLDPHRFAFGKNWSAFLSQLTEERIVEAEKSLANYLQRPSLNQMSFLDIGSGSGLFSLAAHRLGAAVTSFDYDKNSVNCTQFVKDKFFPQATQWNIFQGSILDKELVQSLGLFDIVYSWGVLHHTGDMLTAFENTSHLVKNQGLLFISIYNDQGGASKRWTWIKKTYNKSGKILRSILTFYTLLRQWSVTFFKDLIRTGNPFKTWRTYQKNNRGMSPYYDLIDWVGGYPFEVAKPEDVFNFFRTRGFELLFLKTCAGGLGCNEFVFKRYR